MPSYEPYNIGCKELRFIGLQKESQFTNNCHGLVKNIVSPMNVVIFYIGLKYHYDIIVCHKQ